MNCWPTSGIQGPLTVGTLGSSSTSLGAWTEITPSGGFDIPLEGFYLYACQEANGYGIYFQIGIGPTPLNISSSYLYFQNQGNQQPKILVPVRVPTGNAVYLRGFSGTGSAQSFFAQMYGIPVGAGVVLSGCSSVDGFFNGNYAGLPGFQITTNGSLSLVTTIPSNSIAKNIILGTETADGSSTNFNVNLYAGSSTASNVLIDSIPCWSGNGNYFQLSSQFWTNIPPGTNIYTDVTGMTGGTVGVWVNIFY